MAKRKESVSTSRRSRKTRGTNSGNEKEWTVMVYMSADNNLSEECVWSLKEIMRAGQNDKVGIMVQLDPSATRIQRFDLSANRTPRRPQKAATKPSSMLARLSKETGRSVRSLDSILRVREDTMASVKALKEFIIASKEAHPAKRYLLVLSGHGQGSIGRSFLQDDFPDPARRLRSGKRLRRGTEALTMQGVRNAILSTDRVDVVGMDACGLGMAEAGFQLREATDFMVASEGFEMNTGWPYFEVLTSLYAKPDMKPEDVATMIVDVHTAYYAEFLMAGVSTDISACRLDRSSDLAREVRQLARKLMAQLPSDIGLPRDRGFVRDRRVFVEDLVLSQRAIADAVILAHWRSQSYRFERHTDLYDFCDLLERGCDDQGIIEACRKVKNAIRGENAGEGYVLKSCHTGSAYQHSNGVAVYFPWADVDPAYNSLAFSERAAWGQFLQDYIVTTRRPPRELSGSSRGASRHVDRQAGVRDAPPISRRDAPPLDRRDAPPIDRRDAPPIDRRDAPPLDRRDAPPLDRRDAPPLDRRDAPPLDRRDAPPLDRRDAPQLDRRDASQFNTRDSPPLDRRDAPEIDRRGKLLTPEMKNPPDRFFDDVTESW